MCVGGGGGGVWVWGVCVRGVCGDVGCGCVWGGCGWACVLLMLFNCLLLVCFCSVLFWFLMASCWQVVVVVGFFCSIMLRTDCSRCDLIQNDSF